MDSNPAPITLQITALTSDGKKWGLQSTIDIPTLDTVKAMGNLMVEAVSKSMMRNKYLYYSESWVTEVKN